LTNGNDTHGFGILFMHDRRSSKREQSHVKG